MGFKNLKKSQKIALIVAGVILLSSGAVGAFFGVKKHNTTKAVEAAPAADAATSPAVGE